MKTAYAAIAAIAIMAAAFCLVPMAESDAAEATCSIEPAKSGGFDTMSGGKITIAINHNSFEFELKITVTESGASYKHVEQQVIEKGQKEIVIKMSDMDHSGSHTIKIVLEPAAGSGATLSWYEQAMSIKVGSNPLSNWTTYAIIIVAVALIGIVAYFIIRGNTEKKSKEQTMTFEQLEAERKAEMAAKADKKGTQPKASSTERKKYKAGKKD
jgi:preprotein translocase subunit SecF